MYFYDTCALMNMGESAFDEPFMISAKTLSELESIKTDKRKDEQTRYKARHSSRLLSEHESSKDITVVYTRDFHQDENFSCRDYLPDSPDSVICYAAWRAHNDNKEVVFCTDDICCKNIAHEILNLPVCSSKDILPPDDYDGYKDVVPTDEELADVYAGTDENIFCLIPNQYLVTRDTCGAITGLFKWTGDKHVPIEYKPYNTVMFGSIKAKNDDPYQKLVFDALSSNKITMICGPAGTGKSYLALSYLFKLLESHKIDTIIVFTNPCATNGAAKLGFYPGTRDEKLIDSQIGNMLGSKLGDKIELQRLIDTRKILLLPFSDIRGFDTTKKNCAVYITEAQNLDVDMMKLAVQRIGEDSICIIDGDYDAQVDMDIYSGDNNGMKRLSKVFRGTEVYGEVKLKNIYRSRIAELAQAM